MEHLSGHHDARAVMLMELEYKIFLIYLSRQKHMQSGNMFQAHPLTIT
jgi:hypothetical protein